MAFDLSEITKYADLVSADANIQRQLWSESISLDARNENPMADFIGGEKSGKPIIEKRDLAAGGSAKVHFTTTAPVGGRGVMAGNELKSKTAKLVFGTFSVTVDLRRFAISEDQLVELLRFSNGETRESVLYDLCKQWWGMMEADDLQITLRNKALFASSQPNVLRVGNRANIDAIKLTDTFDVGTIEAGKRKLIGQGAMPMKVDTDKSGSQVPQFCVFAPNEFSVSLEDEQKFREALNNNQQRGEDAFYWTGKYPMWKNNLINRHNIIWDAGNKKQGSPLLPIAFLGEAMADATPTDMTGGGAHNTGGTLTDTVLYDYFSHFGGYYWKTYDLESAPTDNNTYYALIYNVTGADAGKYEIVSWVAAGNNGNTITVTREVNGSSQKTKLTAAGLYSNAHPSGSWIIPCNKYGVPIGRALHFGAEALFLAKGSIDAEEIEWKDDFVAKGSGRAHINSSGIQGIRGYAPYEDSIGRYPNFILVEGALDYGLTLLDTSL